MPRNKGGRGQSGRGMQQNSTRKAKNAGRNKRGDSKVAEAAEAALRAAEKNVGRRGGGAGGAGAGAGVASVASDDSDGDVEEIDIDEEKFLDAQDQVTAKRGSSREAGLSTMIKFIQMNVKSESIKSRKLTMASAALNGLRKNRSKEAQLSCRLLCLLAMHFGPGQEAIAVEWNAALRTALDTKSLNAEAHAAAVTAMSVVTLICCTDEATTEATLGVCEGLITALRTPASVRAAALRAWAFVASVFDGREMQQRSRVIPPFSAHLYHPDTSVRVAAAEALALAKSAVTKTDEDSEEEGDGDAAAASEEENNFDDYFAEYAGDTSSGDDDESDYDEDEVENKKKEWSWRAQLGEEWVEDADEGAARRAYLLDQLHESTVGLLETLRREGARGVSKKEKRAVRGVFRDVHSTVASGVVPISVIRIRESAAELDGWGKRIQLSFFRDLLGPGLQVHLEFNDLVHAILDVGGGVARGRRPKKSRAEKRAFFSPNSSSSRMRTADRSTGRANKAAAKRAFTAGGGVDND